MAEKADAADFLGVTVQPMVKQEGYELIMGSSIDPQFGPVLLFGLGGSLVEVFKDRSLGLPPLNTVLARRLMERTKIFKALKGVRGRAPIDIPMLEETLVRFSLLVAEQRLIKELDINPLLASPERLLALDARVVLYPAEMKETDLPPLAIRPYPAQYTYKWIAKDGTPMLMRPMRPEDEPALVTFHETLSDKTVYLRYLRPMLLEKRVAHERLARICHCDYNREINFAVEIDAEEPSERKILGAARLSKMHGLNEARFSILVSDPVHGRGLGKEMMRRLVEIAKQEKLSHIEALITPDNEAMKHICGQLGFTFVPVAEENLVKAGIDL